MVNPSQVPAMVAAHQDSLRALVYEEFAGYFFRSMFAKENFEDFDYRAMAGMIDESVMDVAKATAFDWVENERSMLNIATLFHVTEPMLAVASHMAEKLHDDERWDVEILPSLNGFMVFEKPLHVVDIWGRKKGIAAVSWHRDTIARDVWSKFGRPEDPVPPIGTLFTFYSDTTDKSDVYMAHLDWENKHVGGMGRWILEYYGSAFDGNTVGPMLNPDGSEMIRKYREKNAAVDAELHEDSPDAAAAHRFMHPEDYDADGKPLGPNDPMPTAKLDSVNQFRIIYTIFALMQQTVASLTEETDRKLARRIKGKRRPPPMVTVIRLRHEEQFGYHEESTGGWLTYRSITRAHFRKQHYKDGVVKRILIHAYWRGPEDAPVWQPARVTSLQR